MPKWHQEQGKHMSQEGLKVKRMRPHPSQKKDGNVRKAPLCLTLSFVPLFRLPLLELPFSPWLSGPGYLLLSHENCFLPPQTGSDCFLTFFPRSGSFRTPSCLKF